MKGDCMAGKIQMVTIPLEEYKELLLRDKPTDREHELCERMLTIIRESIEYTEDNSSWYTNHVGDHMKVEDGGKCVAEIMRMLKYVDFDRYMEIWNSVQTAERNRKAMEAQIEQMNEAKEMRKEAS